MSKSRIAVGGIIVFGLAVILVGFLLLPGQSEDRSSPEPARGGTAATDMGITYLPVTPGVSEYYGLGVEYGALVTDVTPYSPADRAGLRANDVILSFNGARPEEQTPLLGMMMACSAGDTVTLVVWREAEVRMIELFHGTR
jgi:S1-C subfamily serine protease